jgi:membrane protein DedA with SNARE-associated domain
MSVPQLLADYGYLGVLAGSLLEGETVLVLAGFAAHQGYLSLPLVILIAFLGGVLGDQVLFLIGRRWGVALLARVPRFARGAQRIDRMLLRHYAPLIIGVRFMYGLRLIGPIAIGISTVPARSFLIYNLIGAAIWAPLIAGAGYLFGQSLQMMFDDIERYEGVVIAVIVAIFVVIALVHRRRAKRRGAPPDLPPDPPPSS